MMVRELLARLGVDAHAGDRHAALRRPGDGHRALPVLEHRRRGRSAAAAELVGAGRAAAGGVPARLRERAGVASCGCWRGRSDRIELRLGGRLAVTWLTRADIDRDRRRRGRHRRRHRQPARDRGRRGGRRSSARRRTVPRAQGVAALGERRSSTCPRIARAGGGGGHPRAAGFSSDLDRPELVALIEREVGAAVTERTTGMLLLDKAAGRSSFGAIAALRPVLGRKLGHAGTLDPFATGLLIVLAGPRDAARDVPDRSRQAATGPPSGSASRSTTDDPEGDLTATAAATRRGRRAPVAGPVPRRDPPGAAGRERRSTSTASARTSGSGAGRRSTVPARSVTVHAIELLGVRPRRADRASSTSRCSTGTYIRALARDLGDAVGAGGYCAALRRTEVGPFSIDDADHRRRRRGGGAAPAGRRRAAPAAARAHRRPRRTPSPTAARSGAAGEPRGAARAARRRRPAGRDRASRRRHRAARGRCSDEWEASARRRARHVRRRPPRAPSGRADRHRARPRARRPLRRRDVPPPAGVGDRAGARAGLADDDRPPARAAARGRCRRRDRDRVHARARGALGGAVRGRPAGRTARGGRGRGRAELPVRPRPQRRRRTCCARWARSSASPSRIAPLFEIDGEPVSSSRIRELVRLGDVEGAARLLGRPPELEGVVVRGDGRGRELGVPTANLGMEHGFVLPAEGVYAGEVVLGDGRRFRAAISVGTNPTFEGERDVRVEAHLLRLRRGHLRRGDARRVPPRSCAASAGSTGSTT